MDANQLNATDFKVLEMLAEQRGVMQGRRVFTSLDKLASLKLCTNRPWSILQAGRNALSEHQRPLVQKLKDLIAAIDAKLVWLPEVGSSLESWDAHKAGLSRLVLEMTEQEGAVFSNVGDGHALLLCGVRSSCTSGHLGLLKNWQNAARRQIEKMEA